MLIALLGVLIFGGSDGLSLGILSRAGIEQVGERIEATVVDAERRESALNTIKALDTLLEEAEKPNSDSVKNLRTLYEDHASKNDQLVDVVDNFTVDWQILQNRALDQLFEIKDLLTEKEWIQVVGAESVGD